ncbi:MAG: GNAT family N-acetyltransferase [Defluviitaleaceae bacterium]|nr:GNAT family N-acetyltransferase [Defluviitaleaceae bacterium]
MIIRQAQMTDLDAITEVERLCFLPLEAAPRAAFEKRLEAFSDSFLLAEEDGKIIGFINGCITNDKVICDDMFKEISYHDPQADYQAIFGLAVIPERQRQGIATKLMNEFIELTKARGKKGLTLTCKEHRVAFYNSFGYKSMGLSESKHGGATWYDMILSF